jgi:hypothetical protein
MNFILMIHRRAPLLALLLASVLFAWTAEAAKTKPAPEPAKPMPPAAKPVVPKQPTVNPAPVPAVESPAKDDGQVLLFSAVRNTGDLIRKLPAAVVTPQLAAHLGALYASYPSVIRGVAVTGNPPRLHLLAADGSRHLYDDGKRKAAAELLEHADIEDMFFYHYPLTNPTDRLPEDFDPGRARPEAFFKMLYGDSAAAVRANLVDVEFAGRKVKFSKLHGASAALSAVDKALKAALKAEPELKLWLTNLDGTFNWRNIEGTERLSTHSYGIAIDLNADRSKYWRWEKKPGNLATFSRLDFPVPIIAAFEAHGFVWGGKWYHYDTMHFEYRPEILHAAGAKVRPTATGDTVPPKAIPVPEEVPASDSTARYALLIDPVPAAAGMPRASTALKASLEKCGFTVTLLSGAKLDASLEAVQQASRETAAEAVLFHFSGEAIHHKDGLWLVPAGAQISQAQDVHAEAISLASIVEALAKVPAKSRLVLLDIPPANGKEDSGGEGLPFLRTTGFFFGFSGSPSAPGARGWQPEVFTDLLSRRLSSPGTSLSDMFTLLARDIETQTKGAQKPLSTSTLPNIFQFTPGKPASPEKPVQAPPK